MLGWTFPCAERHDAAYDPGRCLVDERREGRVQQIDGHALAAAAAGPLVEGGKDGRRSVEPGDHVDERDADLRRLPGRPRDAHQPADRLDERVVPGRSAPPASPKPLISQYTTPAFAAAICS